MTQEEISKLKQGQKVFCNYPPGRIILETFIQPRYNTRFPNMQGEPHEINGIFVDESSKMWSAAQRSLEDIPSNQLYYFTQAGLVRSKFEYYVKRKLGIL